MSFEHQYRGISKAAQQQQQQQSTRDSWYRSKNSYVRVGIMKSDFQRKKKKNTA